MAGAAACNEPYAPLPDGIEVRVLNPVAWPGENLVLESEAFAFYDELPEIRLDDSSVAVARAGPSTVHISLPEKAGTYQLLFRLHGGRRTGSVRVVGFLGMRDGPPLHGWAQSLEPGSPMMIAAGPTHLLLTDLRSDVVFPTAIVHDPDCLLSAGVSFREKSVVAGRCSGPAHSWQVLPGTFVHDSGPGSGEYQRSELADDLWFNASHHRAILRRASDTIFDIQMEESERLVLSPDGQWAVPIANHTEAGADMPVISTAQPGIAYRLPLQSVYAAAFSPDGDTLFAGGYRSSGDTLYAGGAWLIAISATTGALLAELQDSAMFDYFSLVLDSTSSLMYAFTYQAAVHIIDRTTMQRVRTLPVPFPSGWCCGQSTLALDRENNRLYGLSIYGWGLGGTVGGLSGIWSLELVPIHQQPVVLDH